MLAVIHFAEQRAAAYSMKSSYHKRYTVNNNINATHNILAAIASLAWMSIWCISATWAYTVMEQLAWISRNAISM